jgi:hypothetical protein
MNAAAILGDSESASSRSSFVGLDRSSESCTLGVVAWFSLCLRQARHVDGDAVLARGMATR